MTQRFQWIGTPARDGQHDPPPACIACGATDVVTPVVTDRPGPGGSEIVCHGCLSRALMSVGPATSAHTRRCSGRHSGTDDGRFAVTATWPLISLAGDRWFSCAAHLCQALDALTTERITP
jgi:hypothetical protein